MVKLRCLIVDDEKQAREGLFLMLKQYEALEVVGICTNGLEAIGRVKALKPDLVFLDIQMPKVNGFEVVNSLEAPLPAFVFITAYDQYALKAFEVHALDYLLKPFTQQRLREALEHALAILSAKAEERKDLPHLQNPALAGPSAGLVDSKDFPGRLIVKADGRLNFVEFAMITWVEAYDYYVKVHTRDRYYLVRDTMKSLEEKLPGKDFLRIHKSAIVNAACIQTIEPLGNNDHLIVLTDQTEVKSSRSYAQSLRNWQS